jgi:hypothetical protein
MNSSVKVGYPSADKVGDVLGQPGCVNVSQVNLLADKLSFSLGRIAFTIYLGRVKDIW